MTTDGTDLKLAETNHDIHELLRRRWSPRAFADREISGSTMSSLLEAARWAPRASTNNRGRLSSRIVAML